MYAIRSYYVAISSRLVNLMGGDISMESAAGTGTRFYFCVNLGRSGETLSPAVAQDVAHTSDAKVRVLLAEDDEVSRLMTAKMLQRLGHSVLAVEDGAEALAALRQGEFDLVMMDVQMPVLDGVAAVRAIRAGEAGSDKKDVPVVAMTAYAMEGDRERFLAEGMNGYLSKPIDLAGIRRMVREMSGRG